MFRGRIDGRSLRRPAAYPPRTRARRPSTLPIYGSSGFVGTRVDRETTSSGRAVGSAASAIPIRNGRRHRFGSDRQPCSSPAVAGTLLEHVDEDESDALCDRLEERDRVAVVDQFEHYGYAELLAKTDADVDVSDRTPGEYWPLISEGPARSVRSTRPVSLLGSQS
ncbi:hypothetical protein SAMN04489841_2161 [Natrinema salaciae]|uniref:Uncharacterized protein n=1 Tax=Natrinema salaciae TaxID=1186196 RepID=A0A1H9IA81_9EURY|nr:hypothetical protein SAMN04489841_2161 [Natrinema salaciae]